MAIQKWQVITHLLFGWLPVPDPPPHPQQWSYSAISAPCPPPLSFTYPLIFLPLLYVILLSLFFLPSFLVISPLVNKKANSTFQLCSFCVAFIVLAHSSFHARLPVAYICNCPSLLQICTSSLSFFCLGNVIQIFPIHDCSLFV